MSDKNPQRSRKDARKRCKATHLMICVNCFISNRVSKIQVHHQDVNPFNNDPSNLVPLCNKCHRQWHMGLQEVHKSVQLYLDEWNSGEVLYTNYVKNSAGELRKKEIRTSTKVLESMPKILRYDLDVK